MFSSDLKKLQNYRKEIQSIDAEIFKLLRQRIRLAQKIMQFKSKKKMRLHDPKREAEILNRLTKILGKNSSKLRAKKFIQALLELNVKYPKK